jgi:hypothetical protein
MNDVSPRIQKKYENRLKILEIDKKNLISNINNLENKIFLLKEAVVFFEKTALLYMFGFICLLIIYVLMLVVL